MLVCFNVNPSLYDQDNDYVISRHGNLPDLVVEIPSTRTGRQDVDHKPASYIALGISEYWRFECNDNFHVKKLAGNRLKQGRHEPIPIEEIEQGILPSHRHPRGWMLLNSPDRTTAPER